MAIDPRAIAFSRFGLGPRSGDLKATGDPKAALVNEIANATDLFLADSGLPSTADAFAQIRQFQRARDVLMNPTHAKGPPDPLLPIASLDKDGHVVVPGVKSPSQLMNDELRARVDRMLIVPIGFGERLVSFWTNHFSVQTSTGEEVVGLAGAFEREAIRPFVLGRFADMLLAATQHPAMLLSLNNATSIGPNSPQGKKSGQGLNENHARELMELHTVGVDAGYTQADVTSFAKVLTGWTFGRGEGEPEYYGRFVFHDFAHEPGPQTVMGKTYDQSGVDQGIAVINDLAHRPATATHLATRLARYFVADEPEPALIKTLSDTFLRTKGDLKAMTMALLDAPASWTTSQEKLRTPQEFLWSAIRGLQIEVQPGLITRILSDLGQPLWNPPSPQGFKDDTSTWLAPEAINTRLEVSEQLASLDKSPGDPNQIASSLLDTLMSADTKLAISRAESRAQGLSLLLMSAEFQRR